MKEKLYNILIQAWLLVVFIKVYELIEETIEIKHNEYMRELYDKTVFNSKERV